MAKSARNPGALRPRVPRVQVEVACETSANPRRMLAGERLDLAVLTTGCAPDGETGEVLRHEPLVWATAERQPGQDWGRRLRADPTSGRSEFSLS